MRTFIKCYEYSKIHCVYAKTDEVYCRNRDVLQYKLETMAKQFCCGDILFNDSYPLSKILLQKIFSKEVVLSRPFFIKNIEL